MKPISTIAPPPRPANPFSTSPSSKTSGAANAPTSGIDSFAKLLSNQVNNVNSMQNNADGMVHSLLTGGDVNEAEVLTAVQKADLAFRMLLQVRNKLMEAYREVQQIQI
ncbi:flagellar hook-basal body complex protein FliE [Novipirellula sp.]|uniref:flagellar hook-basal body complex protein FliE n=1 Tax=Novipirellula sp. TaxID=2795430 RepID=UPI0035655EDB